MRGIDSARGKGDPAPPVKSCLIIGAGLARFERCVPAQKARLGRDRSGSPGRIGGRVFTQQFRENPDLYYELGGEWVGRGLIVTLPEC
jgi:hypothetical protein